MLDFSTKVFSAPMGNTHLFFVGQAGFIVKSKKGSLLGIDLYLSDCVERIEGHIGFKRLQPKILHANDIVFDVLITTHPHTDHFDIDSVPKLMANSKTRLFASVDCAKEVGRLYMNDDRIRYVSPGEFFEESDFKIHFINCDHGSGAPDAFGVIIEVDEKRICIVGDTCLRLDRTDEYLSKGVIDILIAPINGAYGNLNEEECAILSDALEPELTIPCHYGMFASHGGSPEKFISIMNSKYKDKRYLLMTQGEGICL